LLKIEFNPNRPAVPAHGCSGSDAEMTSSFGLTKRELLWDFI